MIYFYASLVTYICYCILKYKESLNILKKKKYDSKKYKSEILRKIKVYFLTPELLIIILIIISLKLELKIIEISTIIFYMILFLYSIKKKNSKLKIEKRLMTRITIICLIYIGMNIWFFLDYKSYHTAALIFDNTPLYYIILYTVTYCSYIVVWIANIISKPFDRLIK